MADRDQHDGDAAAKSAVDDVARFVGMTHQVGGHATSLKAHGGKILKPFQNKQRGAREHAFYELVFNTEPAKAVIEQLRPLVPGYHGMVVVPALDAIAGASGAADTHDGQHLVMDDLTYERHWPCIMDVKIGTRSYEDGASAEKVAYEKQKFPLQEAVGFRIQGIKVLDPAQQQYVELDKHYGRSVASREALAQAFQPYLKAHAHDPRTLVVLLEAFLTRLAAFEMWFASQQQFEFIASSLLFLYDGEIDAHSDASDAAQALRVDVRLIDFAHVNYRSSDAPPQLDDGVLLGIRTIISCFRELLAHAKQQV